MPARRRFLHVSAVAGLAGAAGCLSDRPGRGSPTTTDGPDTPDAAKTDPPDPTDANPGSVAWRQSLPGTVSGAPVVAGDRLFVGTDDGTVAALSRADGRVRWEFEADEPIRGTPTVVGDAVLAVSGDVGLGDHHTVRALDAATGAQRWSFAPNDWLLTVLGTAGDAAFVATSDDAIAPSGQNLYALSLDDGSKRWSVEVGDNRGGLVADGTVYVPSTDVVDAVGTDGTRRWRYEGAEYQYRTLSVAGDTVAFATGSGPDDWTVRGLDAATGDRRWTFDEWPAHTTLADGDRLFVGGERVARLDPGSGERRWEADQRAALYDAPVVDDTLYVAGRTAAALGVDEGATAWRRELDAHIATPAGVADGRLVVHRSADRDDRFRHVLALDAASGETAWEYAGEAELATPAVGARRVYTAEGADVVALAL